MDVCKVEKVSRKKQTPIWLSLAVQHTVISVLLKNKTSQLRKFLPLSEGLT